MKRDMNLIRLMLLKREGEEKPDVSMYTEEQQLYHMALLIDAGFVEGDVIKGQNGELRSTVTYGLTWKGHEFLDAARNSTIWQKAVEKVKTAGLSLPLPILQEILSRLIRKQLGID